MSLQQAVKPLFLVVLLLAAFYAYAHDGKFAMPGTAAAKSSTISIDNAWSRATPKGTAVGAGFLTISNKGTSADKLLGGISKIGTVQIHEMKMNYGVMQMRALRSLAVPANGTVELKPGGNHLMFVNLKAPLVEGQDVAATLKFEKAGAIDVTFRVQAAGSAPAHASH